MKMKSTPETRRKFLEATSPMARADILMRGYRHLIDRMLALGLRPARMSPYSLALNLYASVISNREFEFGPVGSGFYDVLERKVLDICVHNFRLHTPPATIETPTGKAAGGNESNESEIILASKRHMEV